MIAYTYLIIMIYLFSPNIESYRCILFTPLIQNFPA